MNKQTQRWTIILVSVFFLLVIGAIINWPRVFTSMKISATEVTNFVEKVAADIARDASATFAKINAAQHPYQNKHKPQLYAFVYDLDVNLVADPDKNLQGKNMKGKPDILGKLFRDEIVQRAQVEGTGWEEYFFTEPGTPGYFPKTTYFKLITGSDGKQYVVCAGLY